MGGILIKSTNTPPAPAPAVAPAPAAPRPEGHVGHGSNISLSGSNHLKNYFLDFDAVGEDSIKMTVKLYGSNAWVGIGFASSPSMTSGGQGSDIFYCSQENNAVMRKWTKEYSVSGGNAVAGSSCAWNAHGTFMTFVRP